MQQIQVGHSVATQTREGRLASHVAGFGFVLASGGSVYVARADLGDALHDDLVEVACWEAERGMQGRVVRILERAPRRLLGTIVRGELVADDERFTRPLRCRVGDAGERGLLPARDVVCGATLQPAGADVEVVIERSFGRRGRARAEEDAMLWRESLDAPFSEEVVDEAVRAACAGDDDVARVDLRKLDFVTIDPASAEDHDDALHAEPLDDGAIRVRVAIADVAAFVAPGGALDAEARRRGTSIYLPRRVVPMLPPVLSTDAASLRPGVDRPAVVLELVLDREARVTSQRLVHATLRCGAKLSYEDAGAILRDGRTGTARERMVALLSELAQRLRATRRDEGALTVDAAEVRIDTDGATGAPRSLRRIEHDAWEHRAHQLVEEMMLLANRTVARSLHEAGVDVLFRGHDAPDTERLAAVIEAARARGVTLDEGAEPAAIRAALAALPPGDTRDELGAALLAALPSATYAGAREDHFALAAREYLHFTSPIRRYADLVVHRAIRARALGATSIAPVDPEIVNETQRRGRAMHREITSLHGALLLAGARGQEREGTVLRTTKRDLWVQLDDPATSVRCARPREAVADGARVRVRIDAISIAARRVEATLLANR